MNTITVLQYILYGLELTACITGIIFWVKIKNSFLKWFPVYLGFIVLAEQSGNWLHYIKEDQIKGNLITYFVIPVEFLFFYWVYYKTAVTDSGRRLVIYCTGIYAAGFILDLLFFIGKEYYFMSFSYCIGNLALLIIIIAFFIQFAKSDKIIHFKTELLFWISLGLLIFYLGTLPYFGLLLLLYDEYREVYYVYSNLMFVCNCIMYSLFSIGFICTKPN